MRKDELLIVCCVLLAVLFFSHAINGRPFSLDSDTAKFIRGILDQYFTRLVVAVVVEGVKREGL